MTAPITRENLTAIDTETWAVDLSAYPAPPLVCLTEAYATGTSIYLRAGLGTIDAVEIARVLLTEAANGTRHLVGTNLVFDLGVLCTAAPDLLPLVMQACVLGTLHSTDLLEALHDNARGLIYQEASGRPIGRYSQALLEARYLGIDRSAEKGPDTWRTRYHELDGVPLPLWPQEAVDYPLADARGCWGVAEIQLGLRATEHGPRHNVQCEADVMRTAWALHLARLWGIGTDAGMVPEVVAALRTAHEQTRVEFFGAGFVRLKTAGKDEEPDDITLAWVHQALGVMNDALLDAASEGREEEVTWRRRRIADLVAAERALSKGKQLRWAVDTKALVAAVTAAYGGSPPTTETGRVSTSRDTLTESGNERLEAFGESGADEKLLTTYAAVLEAGTERPLHPDFLPLVASGRTSYSRPNLQNLPRGGHVRECFVPRPGHVLCSVDYSALELCTLAQVTFTLFGESAMRAAINAGQDLHVRLAARIDGGISYETFAAKLKDRSAKDKRQLAKAPNFGFPGLMGPAKLVLTGRKQGSRFCELSGRSVRCADNPRVTEYRRRTIAPTCSGCLEVAEELQKLWKAEWPEMVPYLEVLSGAAERGQVLESFGNGMLRLDSSGAAYCNHMFQNLAAQGATAALWEVTHEALTDQSSVLYGNLRPLVFIHDEIISEIREEVAHECANRQAEIMVAVMRRYTPDVKISAVPAIARRWFKGMEPVFTPAGRLRPWWPPDAGQPWTWGPDQEAMRLDRSSSGL